MILTLKILSVFSIVGGALTLFAGYGHLAVPSDWGAWLLAEWQKILQGIDTYALTKLGIPPDSGWASLFLFAIFVNSLALDARLGNEKDDRTIKGKALTLIGISIVMTVLLSIGWSNPRKTMNHEAIGCVFLFGSTYFSFYRTPKFWRLTASAIVTVFYGLAFALLLIAPEKKILARHHADIQFALLTGILILSLVIPIWMSTARSLALRMAGILVVFAALVSVDTLMGTFSRW